MARNDNTGVEVSDDDDDNMEIRPMLKRGAVVLKKNTVKCAHCDDYLRLAEVYYICNRDQQIVHASCLQSLFHLGFTSKGEVNLPPHSEWIDLIYLQTEYYQSILSFSMCSSCGDKIDHTSDFYKHLSCSHKICFDCYPMHVMKYGFDLEGKLFCELCKISKNNF